MDNIKVWMLNVIPYPIFADNAKIIRPKRFPNISILIVLLFLILLLSNIPSIDSIQNPDDVSDVDEIEWIFSWKKNY